MPNYEYQCRSGQGHIFEARRCVDERETAICPEHGTVCDKRFLVPAVLGLNHSPISPMNYGDFSEPLVAPENVDNSLMALLNMRPMVEVSVSDTPKSVVDQV